MKVALVYLNRDKYVGRGPGYIAASVRAAGHKLAFFDTAYSIPEGIAGEVADNGCDVLMLSASTMLYKDAVGLARLVKQKRDIPILLGGIHATILREQILNECGYIDYTCVGEGEDFAVEFLDKFGTPELADVRNLGYRGMSGQATINPVRDCTNLDTLPTFPYELYPTASIVQNRPLPGFCYVAATRGCPYTCSYCCNSFHLRMYKKGYLRKTNLDAVIAELQHVKKYRGAKMLYFGDEMILFDREYCVELFTRIKAEVGLPYGCMARVEKIDREMTSLFRETGCCYVGMGIECGDEEFRHEFLNRHMSNAQIIEAFRLLRAVPGMFLTSYNMRGYPVSNDKGLEQSTRVLNDTIGPDIIQISTFYPFPGTKLYDYCIERDLIDPERMATATNVFTDSVLRSPIP